MVKYPQGRPYFPQKAQWNLGKASESQLQGKFYLSLLQNISQGELKSYSHLHNLCNPKSRPDTMCGEDWPQNLIKLTESFFVELLFGLKN